MKTKRNLFQSFVLVAMFVAFPITMQAQFTFTTNNGAITITDNNGSGGALTIPSTINGYPVTSIGDSAFFDSGLTSVTIPNSVTSIGVESFFYCLSLTNVTIGSGVTSIGDGAFSYCYSLTGVNFQGNAPVDGGYIFYRDTIAVGYYLPWTTGWGPTFSGIPMTSSLEGNLGVQYAANPSVGLEPLNVQFNSPGIDNSNNAIVKWNWNFGDGTTSTSQNPSHTYITNGVFYANLVATNNRGTTVFGYGSSITVTATPPVAVFFPLTNGQVVANLASLGGFVSYNFTLGSVVNFSIHEQDINGGAGRWWNGTNFQSVSNSLPAALTGTNWATASGVILPELNSGQSYDLTVNATDSGQNTASATITVAAPITVLNWDPGQTPLGTVVFPNPNTNGGNYWFQISPQSPAIGVWRTALNVLSGQAGVYMSQNTPPTTNSYNFASANLGSNGFVLDASQFQAGQTWYILVNSSTNAHWNLVTGDAFVYNLGSLAANYSSSTNVPIGAEGRVFFNTTIPTNTLAWQLGLSGSTNMVYVKKSSAPDPLTYDLMQAAQMLVVPPYLAGGTYDGFYFVSVPGIPGTPINLDSRQQPITLLSFGAFTNVTVGATNFPYVTYQVTVPVQQIAWQMNLTPSNGVSDIAARLAAVPNEFNNDAYSDVGGGVGNSISLVPPPAGNGGGSPGLSAGTYYITVYGTGSFRCGFTNGSPVITPVSYLFNVTNDSPNRVGWRYYGVSDINSQLGSLGWLLSLSNAPPGSEIAIRRNAVPGQWNYRTTDDNYSYNSAGYVDQSSYINVLQQPRHPADIWYIGVYSPSQPLGNFVLSGQKLISQPVSFDGAGNNMNVVNQAAGAWQYFQVNVPSDTNLLGWDLRLTNVTAGSPQIYVSRDTLPPASLGIATWSTAWPSSAGTTGGTDWTGCGGGPMLEVGMGNPLQPGTYYVGVYDPSYTDSYTLVSRGIGLTNYSIAVKPLNLTGSVTNLALPTGQADYYSVVVTSNTPDWKLHLGLVTGDALLMVQQGYLPNSLNVPGYHGYSTVVNGNGGQEMIKPGDEQWALLPNYGTNSVTPGTYYVLVASQGQNLVNSCGTGTAGYTLSSWIDGVTNLVGTLGYGSDLTYTNSQPGGSLKFYQFTVPAGLASIQVTLENTVGNPWMTLNAGTALISPVHYGSQEYGNYCGAPAQWNSGNLITIPNPQPGTYSLSIYGDDGSATYLDASYLIDVSAPTIPKLSFSQQLNTGNLTNVVSGTLPDTGSAYYQVTVPAAVNGAPVLGWNLGLAESSGSPTVRVRQNLLPDNTSDTTAFASGSIVIAPPYLSPGTWYVEVKAIGSTAFTLTSSVITTNTTARSPWLMPGIGQTSTFPGLALPEFGDSGVDTNGTPLPGDQGVDLAQGQYAFYAILVPTNNAGILRTELQAISGNPNLYIRAGEVPTFNHNSSGQGGTTLIDRQLTSSSTLYGNWVPLNGQTATNLTPGVWILSVYASGNANARFRLELSCGNSVTNGLVQDLPLNGSVTYTNQNLAAGDWRYYRVQIPTNAPNNWVLNWTRSQGSAHLFLRDTVPPGDGGSTYNYNNNLNNYHYDCDWFSDNKNQGPYPDFGSPGSDTLTTPPLRPGNVYYLGFWSPDDATFTVSCATNGGYINITNTVVYNGGAITTNIPAFSALRYHMDVPANATRIVFNATNSTNVIISLEQGTIALPGGPAHWTSYYGNSSQYGNQANASLNEFLDIPGNWPWLPGYSYYLTVTNTSSVAQHFSLTMGLPADLSPFAITVPASVTSAAPNPTVQVIWGVTNLGPAAAIGNWYDAVWFSTDGTLDATAIEIGNFSINQTVTAHSVYWQTNFVTLPMNGTGNYTLFVQVDADNSIYEASLADKISAGVTGIFTLAPPQPIISSISLSGTNLMINGANGQSGATYYVLMSTNLAQPLGQWTRISTNTLNGNGNFTFTATNAVNPRTPKRFYLLQMQ